MVEGRDTLTSTANYDLNGLLAYQQASIILPFDSSRYYLVNTTPSDSTWNAYNSGGGSAFDQLRYHVLDMRDNTAASGIYYYRLLINGTPQSSGKLTVIK